MEYALLFIVAFCPAIFYMLYIIAFDYRKPEPPKALVISALFGIVTAVVVTWTIDAGMFYLVFTD